MEINKRDHELFMKWINKVVEWRHPLSTSSITYIAKIVGVKNGFLLAKDRSSTEGIKEGWIVHTYFEIVK